MTGAPSELARAICALFDVEIADLGTFVRLDYFRPSDSYHYSYWYIRKNAPIPAWRRAVLAVVSGCSNQLSGMKDIPMAKESNFKKVSSSIQKKEGYSKAEADATAAMIGRKKYGKAGMARKAAAGRAKAAK